MTDDEKLMQQALDALLEVNYDQSYAKEVHALRERLAQPEQEPVAWLTWMCAAKIKDCLGRRVIFTRRPFTPPHHSASR